MANALMEFSNGLASTVELAGQAVVAVAEGGRSGVSGVVWREGIAVTAEHTIRGYDEVSLTLPSGSKTKARVLGRDPSTDIAALKLNDNVAPVSFADTAQVKVGHLVLAVGRGTEGLSASYGIVSAMGGAWRTWQGGRVDQWLRLDLNPYPGFSGGPLVDLAGRVLGINTSGPRRTVVTIPNATVDRVVRHILQHGHVARGYLGLGVQPVAFPSALQQSLGLKDSRGLLVVTLAANAPAEKAGVMIGDVIVAIDGVAVADAGDLQSALEPEHVGKPVRVRLVRGGVATEVAITVGERSGRR
jgi:S1-C subfamily serine protease